MSILEVIDLTKIYKQGEHEVVALDSVSFTVEEGEFIAIVGVSGSGKSTLLHIVGGVDRANSGSVLVNGMDAMKLNSNQLADYRRHEVGLIYQFFNLIPFLSVQENIVFPLLLDKRKADQQELHKVIERLNLHDRIRHFPSQLSGGEQQRVAIARTMMCHPALLLADEPTGNLDSVNREHVMDYLDMLNKEHKQTIMMVTHDMDLAKRAGRVLTFLDGKIIKDEVR